VRKGAGTGGTILYYHRNQQFSITSITNSTGAISERYTYTAYGQPTILDASGSILNASTISNRYTYTGREWDATLGLYHFRARWMSPSAGRFLGRDPIGYSDGVNNYELNGASPQASVDPYGNRGYELDEVDIPDWEDNKNWGKAKITIHSTVLACKKPGDCVALCSKKTDYCCLASLESGIPAD
jgi:RHS repeat-associated protein